MDRTTELRSPKLNMGRVHPWVRLGRVGSQNYSSCVGRVGSSVKNV